MAPPAAQSKSYTSEEYRQFVASRFDGQPSDSAWSLRAEQDVARSMVPLMKDSQSSATRVDCRRDLCRYEVRNRDEDAYQKAFDTVLHQRAWNGGIMLLRSPTDPTTLIVYLAKEGESLPSPTSESNAL